MSNENHSFQLSLKAAKRVLVPLLSALIRLGVTLPGLQPLLKAAYVEAAQNILKKQGRKQTMSQLNLMTGVHRRDLRAILDQDLEQDLSVLGKVPLVDALVSEWRTNAAYQDQAGNPRPIPKDDGDGASFFGLVKTLTQDLHPSTILNELEARGLVVLDTATQLYSLSQDQALESQNQNDAFQSLSLIVGGHLETGVGNIFKDRPRELERALYYDNISEESLDELKGLAEERWQLLLEELNAKANALALQDRAKNKKGGSFLFGAFVQSDISTKDEE